MIVAERGFADTNHLAPMAGSSLTASARSSPACSASALFRPSGKPSIGPDGPRRRRSHRDQRGVRCHRLAVTRELGLSEDVVNVEGGAIAHGHPIGASGAILTTRLLHSMKRDGLRRGVVTLCIGGGQGIALALETLV